MSAVMERSEIERDFSTLNKKYPYVFTIRKNSEYKKVLSLLERVMTQDKINEPLMLTISNAIEEYERQLHSVIKLEEDAADTPSGIALIRVLMDQHNLTMSDLPELGKKANVSLILKGDRNLTINHIKKLGERFGIKPAQFIS
jgi:HTH-type transcriptional regulator/antitoxin HigA